jgi:UDP-N-acetylmuramoyl-L-alanyl-D-glutamate--2,6-diaminopimelate ligase
MISTVNAVIGDRVLDTGLHTTTPDAPDVQRYLAQMRAAGMTHCVLETTSHGLAQHRVTACEFDIAVVTNITHEHLDFHGSLEGYRAAKARLFEGLRTAYAKPGLPKLAVLNLDDPSHDYLRERLLNPPEGSGEQARTPSGGSSRIKLIAYGLSEGADVRARNVIYDPARTRFSVDVRQPLLSELEIATALVGEYNVYNALAAITVGLQGLGLDPETVARGVESLKGVPGRMERFDLGQNFTAIVDFAHTPNALRRALETARQMVAGPAGEKTQKGGRGATGRVIVVFGSAGLRDVAKRKWMGEVAAALADFAVITAEDPRTELLEAILAESAGGAASQGGVEGESFWRVADRGQAIRFAVSLAQPGDVVLVCGKAHEQSMCFGTVEYPWDDRAAVRAALSRRLGIPGPEMPRLPTSPDWAAEEPSRPDPWTGPV